MTQSGFQQIAPGSKAAPSSASQRTERPVWRSLRRGWSRRCPSCGEGELYRKYLKVNDACPVCKTELHHHRADDAPPYFVMTITAHIVIGGVFYTERFYPINMWLQLAIWTPILILLSLWLLPRVKGALIGYQWALRMHGFGAIDVEGVDVPPRDPLPAASRNG